MKKDSKEREGWFLQDNLMYAGLIGVGVVLVQPFLTVSSYDPSAVVCIVAFALALPIMAVLVMINRLESLYRYSSYPRYLSIAKGAAVLSASVGVVAAFWHMMWVAGVVVTVSGLLAVSVHSAYYVRMGRALKFTFDDGTETPGDDVTAP